MNDKLTQTQRILRSPKFTTDDQGHTVLVDTVDKPNLELMSTQMLQTVIDGNDADAKADLRELADGENGLIARDMDKGRFEVINDEELQRILDGSDPDSVKKGLAGSVEEESVEIVDDGDDLDLVSTQMLRIALNLNDDEETPAESFVDESFDPYNKG